MSDFEIKFNIKIDLYIKPFYQALQYLVEMI